jgi:arabinoxylan arabinofuranohydrolase
MQLRTFSLAMMMAFGLQLNAQTMAKEFKATSEGNPISGSVFCADPTALEYNGRLYVYGSNDHQEFIAKGKKGENEYGNIKSIVVFSTEDMVNWTFHGTIDTKKLCAGWTPSVWYKGYGVSWAPSVIWRTNAETGKDEFFLYFCNSSHGVGVLTAESPIGPWKSPNKELMIHYDTPGANKTGTNANFDPGVTIDDNGVGWISFGGLGPSTMMPEAARIIKLKPSMTAVDGSAVKIPAPYHFEANELNVIGGKYVYTYCSNWANRNEFANDWNAYKTEKGISASAPDACTMCYMVSDNPMDPNSWVYKGVYGVHPGNGTNNNHSHLQKFKGTYYHIYHNAILRENMKAANAVDANLGIFRSLCVNKATVNESTATISKVKLDLTGPDLVGDGMNPYEGVQAETMATCGGVEYEDFTNIKKNGRINALGNDASENMQVRMKEGCWTYLRKVNFGSAGASKITLRAKGEGTIEMRFGRKGAKASATIDVSSDEMTDITVDVDPTVFTGTKNIFILVASGEVYLDAWQATAAQADAIKTIERQQTAAQRYDLSGRRLDNADHRGLLIEQYQDAQGNTHARKRVQ